MTLPLADRIEFYLADEGRPMTAGEIALGVKCRKHDVIAVLEADRRFALTLPGRRSPRAKLWVVLDLSAARDTTGTVHTEGVAA